MLRRLDRYVIREIFRVVIITTVVLVTVLAFGAAIKPLARDNLLTAGQTLKYIGLAIVPMLQFALPFAAGFAGTISLHRMTSDNEIVAAAASGISYRRILVPVAVLGLALMLFMVGLTQWVIPRFWGMLERSIAHDITRIFQASIERGEPFSFGDRQIYADRLIVETDPENSDADTRLILLRVAAAELDSKGRIDKEVTANNAVVDIYRRPGVTYIMLAMADTVAYNPEAGMLVSTERTDFRPIVLPSVVSHDAQHMTRGELLALRHDLDSYGPVIERKLALAEALRDVELWRQIDEQLRTRGEVEFRNRAGDGRRFVVEARRLRGGTFTAGANRPVVVTQHEDGRAVLRMRAAEARLERYASGPLADLAFDLQLDDCEVTDLDAPETANRRRRVALENLEGAGVSAADLALEPCVALLARAEALEGSDRAAVRPSADLLKHRIGEVRREISARLLRRYALSITALLLITLGATLAMLLRHSLPLVIYLWAFVPAILDLILINTGEHMMRDGSMTAGKWVMWLGNAIVALFILFVYRRLARN